MGVRATGLQSIKHVILFFFGMGTMMDFLKHEGTTDRERDRLKISVKTPASWKAHALSTPPGIPSGPTALRMFTRLKDRVTSVTESVSGLTSSAAAEFWSYCSEVGFIEVPCDNESCIWVRGFLLTYIPVQFPECLVCVGLGGDINSCDYDRCKFPR